MLRRYLLYLVRWQLSTPVLALCVVYFARFGDLWSTVIANFIGGLVFFWIDRFIFSPRLDRPIWEIRKRAACIDCGRTGRGYRLVAAYNYDRREDSKPEFRCEECSTRKTLMLEDRGILVE